MRGELDFDVSLGGNQVLERTLEESITLIKPLVGGQLSLELSDQWGLGLRGDISGLNIGGGDAFSWSILASSRYRFSPSVAVQAAYQLKEFDYSFGEGRSEFGIEQFQHGVWVGLDIEL